MSVPTRALIAILLFIKKHVAIISKMLYDDIMEVLLWNWFENKRI